MKKILVTGGSGFIGSNLINIALRRNFKILNFDALTYAGSQQNNKEIENSENYQFFKGNILDVSDVRSAIESFRPDGVMHLAAESHVDRSIRGAREFIDTNIKGTYNLLELFRAYWDSQDRPNSFVFHHISTDEVFGSMQPNQYASESTSYSPNNPYAASKASSDHLARAWYKTYKLPVIITNCSNNYGPLQFPEKLIPVSIINAIEGNKIPIYGNGTNVRDWLYVDDHANALLKVFEEGSIGQTYNIGGNNEVENITLVRSICSILDRLKPKKNSYKEQITHVEDRLGHDQRYALDISKINIELGWQSKVKLQEGLIKTVEWYLDNEKWWRALFKKSHSV